MKRFLIPPKAQEGGDGNKRPHLEEGARKGEAAPSPGPTHPLRLMSWNCNGLLPRLKNEADQRAFKNLLDQEKPDLITLQEVCCWCGAPTWFSFWCYRIHLTLLLCGASSGEAAGA
jgi:hypothetical protein